MVLRAKPGTFEEDGNTATIEKAPLEQVANKPTVQAPTALVRAPTRAVGLVSQFAGLQRGKLFGDLKTDEPPFEFGTFPRFSGNQRMLMTQDGKMTLGASAVVQLISYNDWYLISPGERTKESTEFVKYSNDGKTINGTGQSVDEYLNYLRTTEGLKDSSKKSYTSLWGLVLQLGDGGDCPQLLYKVVEISLAPMSRKSLTEYETNRQISNAQQKTRHEYSAILTITTSVQSKDGNNYTKLIVGGTEDAKAEQLLASFAPEVTQ
jgi:hypothetical protein